MVADKETSGKLTIILSVVVFLFLTGFLIMVFSIFGGELQSATATTITTQQNASVWWNASYPYRFLVTNVSNDVAVLNVTYRTGMASDFSDLVAVAYDDTTQLTLDINSYTASSVANLNVTLSPSLNKTFYIYYGL